MDLVIIITVSFLLVPVALFTTGTFRIILSLILILFCPGYSLIAALFPEKDRLKAIERVVLSIVLSIALVPLIGLVFYYSPWGSELYPILFLVLFFVIIMTIVAYYRRKKLALKDRFELRLGSSFREISRALTFHGRLYTVIAILLGITVVGSMAVVFYVITAPKIGEDFTEFYIVGKEGQALDYPHEIILGAESMVILGVVNQEHRETSYVIRLYIKGEPSKMRLGEDEIWRDALVISLGSGMEWQKQVFFATRELCSSTWLVSRALPEKRIIQVDSVQYLEEDDYIQIIRPYREKPEFAQIESINNDLLTLKKDLQFSHEVSTPVIEIHKFEFILNKYDDPNPYRRLHIWVNVKDNVGE